MKLMIPNPGIHGGRLAARFVNPCGGVKPIDEITDRAKRYRANAPGCRPDGPRVCAYCGSKRNVEVHHVDGNEDHTRRSNLKWACRRCNTTLGVKAKQAGKGKRTRQFNPAKGGKRYPTFAEYMAAAAEHRRGARDKGGAVIHATPVWLRKEYAARAWELRRERGTDKEVPF